MTGDVVRVALPEQRLPTQRTASADARGSTLQPEASGGADRQDSRLGSIDSSGPGMGAE